MYERRRKSLNAAALKIIWHRFISSVVTCREIAEGTRWCDLYATMGEQDATDTNFGLMEGRQSNCRWSPTPLRDSKGGPSGPVARGNVVRQWRGEGTRRHPVVSIYLSRHAHGVPAADQPTKLSWALPLTFRLLQVLFRAGYTSDTTSTSPL